MNPSAKAMPACYSPTPITSSGAIAEVASVKLKVADLHKSYGELQVLKGVSLNARNGDVISMVGASGSGKSTMLNPEHTECVLRPILGIEILLLLQAFPHPKCG